MIRVLVVDDQPVIRSGVRRIFETVSDVTIEEAEDAEVALEKIRTESWDVVLLELTLPGRSGLELLFELKDRLAKLPVLIFSSHKDESSVSRTLKAGAVGYVTKDCAPEQLIKAVHLAAMGGRYVMPELGGTLIGALQSGDERPSHEHLSGREYEVMVLLARGQPVRQISNHLCLSESTVSTYRTRILDKLRLANNAEITRYALAHGLYE